MKKILFKCLILASVFMIIVGCSNSSVSTVKGNTKNKTTSIEKENEKTIQTFLKVEITGPNEE
jgi:hypothetical protein